MWFFNVHDGSPDQAVENLPAIRMLDPQDIAAQIIHVLKLPTHVQIDDIRMRPTEQVT